MTSRQSRQKQDYDYHAERTFALDDNELYIGLCPKWLPGRIIAVKPYDVQLMDETVVYRRLVHIRSGVPLSSGGELNET